MTAIAADPLVMTSVKFSINDPDVPATFLEYECHVSAVTLEPEAELITYETLCPDGSFSALGREKWSMAVTAIQDWSADGFTRFLWEHAGENAHVKFAPGGNAAPSADEPWFECDVVIPRPPVGGEVSTFAVAELVFPVTGTPTLDAVA